MYFFWTFCILIKVVKADTASTHKICRDTRTQTHKHTYTHIHTQKLHSNNFISSENFLSSKNVRQKFSKSHPKDLQDER